MAEPFRDHRDAARAILRTALDCGEMRPREGQFLGGLAFDANPMTEKQANWLRILLERASLPPYAGDVQ